VISCCAETRHESAEPLPAASDRISRRKCRILSLAVT
jgi:hypothetical protein